MHNIFNLRDTELKVSYALYWFYQREPIKQQSMGRHVAPLNLIPRRSSLCSFTLNAACLAETQQIPISVYRLTRQRLELTIYHTLGGQANHYTIRIRLKTKLKMKTISSLNAQNMRYFYNQLTLNNHNTGWWFSPGSSVSFTNKTDRHDITERLLKVALNTTKQTSKHC